MASVIPANTANSILFLFNIWWTIRMKSYLQYSQWITERSLYNAYVYTYWYASVPVYR